MMVYVKVLIERVIDDDTTVEQHGWRITSKHIYPWSTPSTLRVQYR